MPVMVVMMLGICLPAFAAGVAKADDVPPAPPPVAGELTDGERLFQGVWQYHAYESDRNVGTLRIEDRTFHADVIHGRYAGHVAIHTDTSPAQIDFTIEDCDCKFEGMTSKGIYYEDDGTIVFAAPAPGEARPEAFTGTNEMVRLRRPDPATRGDHEAPR